MKDCIFAGCINTAKRHFSYCGLHLPKKKKSEVVKSSSVDVSNASVVIQHNGESNYACLEKYLQFTGGTIQRILPIDYDSHWNLAILQDHTQMLKSHVQMISTLSNTVEVLRQEVIELKRVQAAYEDTKWRQFLTNATTATIPKY